MTTTLIKKGRSLFLKIMAENQRIFFPSPFEGLKDKWLLTSEQTVRLYISMYDIMFISYYQDEGDIYIQNMSKQLL